MMSILLIVFVAHNSSSSSSTSNLFSLGNLIIALLAVIVTVVVAVFAYPPIAKSIKNRSQNSTLELIDRSLTIERRERKELEERSIQERNDMEARHGREMEKLRNQLHEQDKECQRKLGELQGQITGLTGGLAKELVAEFRRGMKETITPIITEAIDGAMKKRGA